MAHLYAKKLLLDCYNVSAALAVKPQYVKALMRRARAYEATEKYEEALQGNPDAGSTVGIKVYSSRSSDYKKVLELDPSQTSARDASMVMICT